jgi:hypothetical protein
MSDTPKFVLLIGNPIDGLVAVGPFVNKQGAIDWGEHHHSETEWWATALIAPADIKAAEQHVTTLTH